jgi:hypothetical protein
MVIVTNHTIEVTLLELSGIDVHDNLRPYGRPGRSLKEVHALISFYRKKNVETTLPSRPLKPQSKVMGNENSSIPYSAKWAIEGRDKDQDRHKGKVLIQTNLHRSNKKDDSQFEVKAYELIIGLSKEDEGIVLGLSALNVRGPVLDMEVDLPLAPVGSKMFKKKSFLSLGGDDNSGFNSVQPVSFKSDTGIHYKLSENARMRAKITVMESTAYLMHKMQMMSQGTISQVVTTRPHSTSTTSTMSQTIFPADGGPPIRRKPDKNLLPPKRTRSRSGGSRLNPQSNIIDHRQDFNMNARQGMSDQRMMELQETKFIGMPHGQFFEDGKSGFQQDFSQKIVEDNFAGEGSDYDNMQNLVDDMTIGEEDLHFGALSKEDEQSNHGNREDEEDIQLAEFYEDIQNGAVVDGNSYVQGENSIFDSNDEIRNDVQYINNQGQHNPISSGRTRSYRNHQVDGNNHRRQQLPRSNSQHRHVQGHQYEGESFRSNQEFPPGAQRPSRGAPPGSFQGPPSIMPRDGNHPAQYEGESFRSNQEAPFPSGAPRPSRGAPPGSFQGPPSIMPRDGNHPAILPKGTSQRFHGGDARSFRSNQHIPFQENHLTELEVHNFLAKTSHAVPEIDFQSAAPCEDMSDSSSESSESESESESSESKTKEVKKDPNTRARKDPNTRTMTRETSESSGSDDDFIGQFGGLVNRFFGDTLDGPVGVRQDPRSGRKQRKKKPMTATTEKQRGGGRQVSATGMGSPELLQGCGPVQGWAQNTTGHERNKPAPIRRKKSGKGKPTTSPEEPGRHKSAEMRKHTRGQDKQRNTANKLQTPMHPSIETAEV